ncbi:hypothetical protein PMIN03_012616 [Paraphaeosphaeria minitans]
MAPEYPLEQCVRPTNVGLPGEEYTLRKERHNARLHHTHLEDVYARHSLGMQGPMRRGQLDAWGPNPELPYRKPVGTATAGKLPTTKHADHALRQSEVANATRRALGRSWHPTDHLDDGLEKYAVPRVSSDWHEVPQRRDPIPDKYIQEYAKLFYGNEGDIMQQEGAISDEYLEELNQEFDRLLCEHVRDAMQRENTIPEKYLHEFNRTLYEYDEDNPHARYKQTEQEDPIPDKYLREFNRLWYEDDEDNDADQLVADLTPNAYAPWRTHLPLRPMYCPDAEFRTSTHYWDKTEITNWSKASFKASGTHREVVEPGPLNQTESQGCVRWSDLTLAHQEVPEPKPIVQPEPQSFFDWSDSSSPEEIPEESRRKKHSRASSHWKRLTKGFQHSHRA